MKSKKIALTLASIALLASSGSETTLAYVENFYAAANANGIDTGEVISNMREGFHINASITDATSYPDDYNYMDASETTTAERIYGYINNDDGSQTAACKIIYETGEESLVYEGEDGGAYYDELTTQNEIVTTQITDTAMPVQFAVYYRNPFDYIFASDIDEDYYLNTDKASFILNEIVGVDKPVKSALLTIDSEDRITAIDYEFYGQISGYQGSDDVITADIASTASVTFTYNDLATLARVQPASNENPALDAAIAEMYSATNYTTYISSNYFDITIAMYLSDNAMYVHYDAYATGPVEGDIYLKEHAIFAGQYYYYYFDGASWSNYGTVSLSDLSVYFLPDLANASTALFEYDHGTYRLIPEAVTYVAPYMLFYMYSYQLIDYLYGYGGYIRLDDEGHIKRVESYNVYYYYTMTFTQTFTDWGTTSLPAWFDTDSVK